MQKVTLYTKTIKYMKDGKEASFPKLMGAILKNDKKIILEIGFSKPCKKEFDKQMIVKELEYPVSIMIGEQPEDDFGRNYWIIKEETKKGEKTYTNKKLIINNFENLEKETWEVGDKYKRVEASINDLFTELEVEE